MKTNNWEKAKEIFGDALKLTPDERPRFLDETCDGDAAVRREVESLLSSFDRAEVFLEKPAVGEMTAATIKKCLFAKGQSLGHYEIIQPVGTGGMGEVYLAEDTRLNRRVALKVLSAATAARNWAMARRGCTAN